MTPVGTGESIIKAWNNYLVMESVLTLINKERIKVFSLSGSKLLLSNKIIAFPTTCSSKSISCAKPRRLPIAVVGLLPCCRG